MGNRSEKCIDSFRKKRYLQVGQGDCGVKKRIFDAYAGPSGLFQDENGHKR